MRPTERLTDVWTLETPNEELASDEVNLIASRALKGNKEAQKYLRWLWDGESWRSIKAKLKTEGSDWYVWWMDGVRRHLGTTLDSM